MELDANCADCKPRCVEVVLVEGITKTGMPQKYGFRIPPPSHFLTFFPNFPDIFNRLIIVVCDFKEATSFFRRGLFFSNIFIGIFRDICLVSLTTSRICLVSKSCGRYPVKMKRGSSSLHVFLFFLKKKALGL